MAGVLPIPRAKLSKIPGGDVVLPHTKEVHTKDLTKLTQIELLEIKDREGKLLTNKSKLARLPDKGKRIQDFYDKVIAELERRANIDEAAAMFSELNIANKAKNALNELEWTGNLNAIHEVDPTNDIIDSDDEIEMDPLRIIAKGTMHERKVKIIPAETNLITAKDLAEISTFNAGSTDSGLGTLMNTNDRDSETTDSASETSIVDAELVAVDVGEKLAKIKSRLETLTTKRENATKPLENFDIHVRYLVNKTEVQSAPAQRVKFMPYKTTKSDVHAPEKERERKKGKYWEVTAATPPPIQHKSTQMLPLLDSVQIQETYLAKMTKLQAEQAAERLAAKVERLAQRNIIIPSTEVLQNNPAFTSYRTRESENIEGSQRFKEDDEVHDTLDDERSGGGGVTYTIYE